MVLCETPLTLPVCMPPVPCRDAEAMSLARVMWPEELGLGMELKAPFKFVLFP